MPRTVCPRCSSDYLMIRQDTGFERLMIWITGMRKYLCLGCNRPFRAPDRRHVPREKDGRELSRASDSKVA